jgi:hypothetical protein
MSGVTQKEKLIIFIFPCVSHGLPAAKEGPAHLSCRFYLTFRKRIWFM